MFTFFCALLISIWSGNWARGAHTHDRIFDRVIHWNAHIGRTDATVFNILNSIDKSKKFTSFITRDSPQIPQNRQRIPPPRTRFAFRCFYLHPSFQKEVSNRKTEHKLWFFCVVRTNVLACCRTWPPDSLTSLLLRCANVCVCVCMCV